MSIKIYNGLIIRNADYKEVFNDLNKIKNEITIEMKNKFEYFLTNLSKKFIEEQNKNNEIEISDYFELNEVLSKKNIEDLYSLLYYYVRFYEKNINNLSIESCFSYLNSTIALFPNGDDILVLKYIQMKEIDDIIAKHLKLEDYSYYDNSDLPYEEFKESEEEYVSKEDWEKRLEDWNKVLLKNQNDIPSQNSIQLNLEWNRICSVLEFLNKEENNHFKNFKVNLIRKKDKSIDMEM